MMSKASQEWQPIATAPKDGTIIILSDGRWVHPGAWAPAVQGDSYPWIFVEDLTGAGHQPVGCCDREDASRIEVNAWRDDGPSHWMPLPALPVTGEVA